MTGRLSWGGRADMNPAKARLRSVKNAAVLGSKAALRLFYQGPAFFKDLRGIHVRPAYFMVKSWLEIGFCG
ncbi:MAG: hypothetical protein NC419_04285 [Muribaculaceae bacterium]|nr:hypothetical protein [Muribaculaceae bacterium]